MLLGQIGETVVRPLAFYEGDGGSAAQFDYKWVALVLKTSVGGIHCSGVTHVNKGESSPQK